MPRNCDGTTLHVLLVIDHVLSKKTMFLFDATLREVACRAEVLMPGLAWTALWMMAGPAHHSHDEVSDLWLIYR